MAYGLRLHRRALLAGVSFSSNAADDENASQGLRQTGFPIQVGTTSGKLLLLSSSSTL